MRLLSLLIMRLMALVLLCLAIAIMFVTVDTHSAMDRETASSAARVSQHLQSLYWQKLLWRDGYVKDTLLPMPDWETLDTQKVIGPGICVTFAPPRQDQHTLCSQAEALGPLPPEWFANLYIGLLGSHQPITTPLSVRQQNAGLVTTTANEDAALRIAWRQASTITGVATALSSAIAVLAAIMIGYALLPASAIIQALHRLERGELTVRLPRFASDDLNHIARAVNSLAAKLFETNAERRALTARLFQVQEEERRALARDLHDEFGQSLTATRALASLIETSAPPDRQDIVDDARSIGRIQIKMMEVLRTTLVRLRSQNIEELGLEASLRQLVADHNQQSGSRTVFKLDIVGSVAALHKRMAVDLYRITQECLTNAVRHGSPTEVHVVLSRVADNDSVALLVEDNGGGDVGRFSAGRGHGILGIKERLAALGGYLNISNAAHGIRVSATIPLEGKTRATSMAGAGA